MTIETSYSPATSPVKTRFILPIMGKFYESFAEPLAFTAFRVAIGAMLVIEGYPKSWRPWPRSAL